MGLILSIPSKFVEYMARNELGNVFSNESSTDSKLKPMAEINGEEEIVEQWMQVAYGNGYALNSDAYEISELRMSALNGIMEALTDDNINIIGLYGSDSADKVTLLKKVSRRAERDNLFDVVVIATVTKKPDLKRIQEDIAHKIGLKFDENKDVAERSYLLRYKMKEKQKILVVLCDVWKILDLGKLGIPFGADHTGCKILLTSTSEEVLSNKMPTQKYFKL